MLINIVRPYQFTGATETSVADELHVGFVTLMLHTCRSLPAPFETNQPQINTDIAAKRGAMAKSLWPVLFTPNVSNI